MMSLRFYTDIVVLKLAVNNYSVCSTLVTFDISCHDNDEVGLLNIHAN